jgi:hypothetical protein
MPTKRHHGTILHERFEIKRTNHQEAYSLDGACTNMAEEYLSIITSRDRICFATHRSPHGERITAASPTEIR